MNKLIKVNNAFGHEKLALMYIYEKLINSMFIAKGNIDGKWL